MLQTSLDRSTTQPPRFAQVVPAPWVSPIERSLLVLAGMLSSLVIAVPRLTPGVVVALAIGSWLLARPRESRSVGIQTTWFDAVWCGLFLGWLAISMAWSLDWARALGAVANLALIGGATVWALTAAVELQPATRRDAARWFLILIATAAAVSAFEVATSFAGRRWLYTVLPVVRPQDDVWMAVVGGRVVELAPYVANRGIAMLMLLAWPAIILLDGGLIKGHAATALKVCAVAGAGAILVSEHQSSALALIVSLLVFGCVRTYPNLVRPVLWAVWTGACLAVVPVTLLLFHVGLHRQTDIQDSGRHRIVIWRQTSLAVLEAPVKGHGLASTRTEAAQVTRAGARPNVEDTRYPQSLDVHAHNVFLQTWYEAGGIGAVLLWLAGGGVIGFIGRAHAAVRSQLTAAFTAAVVIASLSWSLIAPWFVAALAMSVIWSRFAHDWSQDGEGTS